MVNKRIYLLFVTICISITVFGQNDSNKTTLIKDNVRLKKDSFIVNNTIKDSLKSIADSVVKFNENNDSTVYTLLQKFPLIKDNANSQTILTTYKNFEDKTIIFYVLACCFLLLGITKSYFPKYFQSIFSIFFQTNFRQRQTKEQLLQDNLASLFNNVVFFLGVASLASLIIPHYTKNINLKLWQIFIASLITIVSIYSVKFLFIRFLGWVFNNKDASEAYIFIVFIINKIIGVLLLPFCLLAAFSTNQVIAIAEVVGVCIISILLFYRMILTFRSTNSRLKINLLHFFIYFCSLEILPLLIVFKVLQNYL